MLEDRGCSCNGGVACGVAAKGGAKYLPATNNRGARIKATAWAGSVTIGYDWELDAADNHCDAADALIAKLDWKGTYVQGCNIKGNGYRLVVLVRYGQGLMFIRFVGSHNQYNKIDAATI
jgi:hypothetical protein